ncbi:MAG: hypothetical protein NZ846_11475 [Thermus sp.]|uniref:hypothetical protein n=1 Tax=unclassified Thermus TaxID=2619321 RepID=UPI0002389F7C|nr:MULTISPECIES: hypothetical protein [unclassified Thermus]AEV16160.1 hypothetical protein TCCBUS3UF1_11160 [Thermus sp. CCB_US3_UF1]MCS6868688.1 hypothetical protein [Thermus sp.]MCS7219565.1 hypothetical protein [Thermus sp.]MDW8358425.1 hypothetical protein [Thermus sp.]
MEGKLLLLRVFPKAHLPLVLKEGDRVRRFKDWGNLLRYLEERYPLPSNPVNRGKGVR